MEFTKEQITDGLNKAYLKAGHHAYFGNGFKAGIRFATEKQLSNRFKDNKFIDNVIVSYRHDFGLLTKEEQEKLRFECKEWMRAIKNNENYF